MERLLSICAFLIQKTSGLKVSNGYEIGVFIENFARLEIGFRNKAKYTEKRSLHGVYEHLSTLLIQDQSKGHL